MSVYTYKGGITMFLLWTFSFVVAIFALVFGMMKQSWLLLLISGVAFFPVFSYFWGAENGWKYLAFTPITLLVGAFYLRQFTQRRQTR